MSLTHDITDSPFSDLPIWVLTGLLLGAIYFFYSDRITQFDSSGEVVFTDLREQALESERRLQQLIPSANDGGSGQKGHSKAHIKELTLLENAADQAVAGDPLRLSTQLLSLSRLNIEKLNLLDAELYARESLAVAKKHQLSKLEALSLQQMGLINIKRRNLARRAAHAYDALLVVRNRISLGHFQNTPQIIKTIVEDNLAINRYGAAASALQTLSRFYEIQFDEYQSNMAKIEAVRLFAKTGAVKKVRSLLASLSKGELDDYQLSNLETEVNTLLVDYASNRNRYLQAQDFLSLYHQYKNRGDKQRAWQFRLKAAEILAKTNNQAMYHRHPDVLAVLYKSNEAMDEASKYLKQAEELFATQGLLELQNQSRQMQSLIY